MRLTITSTAVAFLMIFIGCREDDAVRDEIASIPVELEIDRFDRELAGTTVETWENLRDRYPYLFPEKYSDSLWKAKLSDTLQIALLQETDLKFGTFREEAEELELFFKHLKFYYPDVQVPRIITLISEVDYSNRIVMNDTLVLIGLDNYLGADHRFYQGIDRYITKSLDSDYLISDLAGVVANRMVPYPRERTFLAKIIYHGKMLYFKDMMIPWNSDEQRIQYTAEELEWARANESQIWRYFVERELLYSTDNGLDARFIDPAPFSKFRLELDNESPGRLGRYIGWQIVRSYMKRNETDLRQVLAMPAMEIFNNSGYKPPKG